MSKIGDALRRAAAERVARATRETPGASNVQSMWEEVEQLESSLASWDARSAVRPAPAREELDERGGERTLEAPRSIDQPQDLTPVEPTAQSEDIAAPSEAWEQAIQRCQARLLEYEQQALRHSWEQRLLQAQVAAEERLLAEQSEQIEVARRKIAVTGQAMASIEAAKAAQWRCLDALRECQALSHETRVAEMELQATGEMVARVTELERRHTEELSRYRKRNEELRRTVDQLRFQLGQALARTETATSAASEQAAS